MLGLINKKAVEMFTQKRNIELGADVLLYSSEDLGKGDTAGGVGWGHVDMTADVTNQGAIAICFKVRLCRGADLHVLTRQHNDNALQELCGHYTCLLLCTILNC